ncbi:MAG: DegT/DnrJ/EryC1/StrS family aminotransferase [Bacteroidales bacterium]|jgi:dTDP-4-amino-4,6-dideoxygalactose transaminase|nr:DegT/DnrJ/EryC1/StrS family aminotransferase [Bacteroidales bacterium]
MEINNKEIRLSRSVIGQEEIDAVTDVLKRQYLGMGQDVQLFEQELSSFFNREVVCVNTGTAALHLALQAIGLKEGDEVLVQSLTYVATYQAISATGATPVSCEVVPETCTIDLVDAERKITPNTKAILPVHYAGNVGDLKGVYTLAKKYNLRVIEDAAHAFGTTYNSKLIGSFGDICCISLDGIKNITSGEGGIIITDDETVLSRIKDARLLGVEKDTENRFKGQRSWDFDVTQQGWRYHMSNIMAAIGRVQLKKFPKFKEKRQELAALYKNCLKDIEGIELLDIDYNYVVPHIFVIRILGGKRDIVKTKLENLGIPTGIHYKPNHLLTYFNGKSERLKETETVYNELLTLPIHPCIEENEIEFIIKGIKDILR